MLNEEVRDYAKQIEISFYICITIAVIVVIIFLAILYTDSLDKKDICKDNNLKLSMAEKYCCNNSNTFTTCYELIKVNGKWKLKQ